MIIEPVVAGSQSDSTAQIDLATGVASSASQPSGARSFQRLLQLAEARDGLRGHRLHRARRHEVHANAVLAEVAGEVAVDRLQRRLRHAHPVVGGPRDAGVEVEADDRRAPRQQRQQRGREGLERVRRDLEPVRDVPLRRVDERRAEAGLRVGESDRVQHAVDPVHVLTHPVGQRVQVLLVLHVELDHRRRLRQPLGDPLDEAHPAEAGQHDGGALFLGDLGRVERDRRVGDHTGDEQALTLEQTGHLPFLLGR